MLMNKIIYILCVAATFLFAACDSSTSIENEEGEISICMSLPPNLSVETRSGIADVINNVWVMQFSEGDGRLLHAECFDNTKIAPIGSSGALLQVTTSNFLILKAPFV